MKVNGKYDLLAILILTALLALSTALVPSNIPRIIIGLPFLLFFPGYTLIAALFPQRDAIGSIERVALSFGLSIAVVPLIGLILNYAWEISLYPILVSITTFIIIMCIATYFRRRQLPPEQRFEPTIILRLPELKGQNKLDHTLSIILAFAIIAAIGTLIYTIAAPKTGEKFTEFYILGLHNIAEDYPKDITLGEDAELTIGIINHESLNTSYKVKIEIDNEQVDETNPIILADSEKWEGIVSFAPTKTGDEQKVEFLLYRNNESDYYLSTHLWINVSAP